MRGAKLQIHPAGLAVICFALVAWLIALGGVSGAAYSCARGQEALLRAEQEQEAGGDADDWRAVNATTTALLLAARAGITAPTFPPAAAATVVAPAPPTTTSSSSSSSSSSYAAYASCAQAYQWEWFSLWFSFALLVAMLATGFVADAFRRGRAALLAFCTLASLCLLLSAHNFITRVDISARVDVRDLDQDSVNAAAAGFTLLAMSTMALMLALGSNFSCAGCAAASQRAGAGHLLGEGGIAGSVGVDYGSAHVRFQASPPI